MGVSAASDVPDQPMGEAETRQGAMNRARSALATYRGEHGEDAAVAFSVGLEGGVCDDVVTDAKTGEEVANTLRCMAWMAVLRPSDGRWGIAHTGGFPLPHKVAQLVRGGMELGHADDQVFGVRAALLLLPLFPASQAPATPSAPIRSSRTGTPPP